jgi:hypothetical protein
MTDTRVPEEAVRALIERLRAYKFVSIPVGEDKHPAICDDAADALDLYASLRPIGDEKAQWRVKQLEWRPAGSGDWRAESAVGDYEACWRDNEYIVILDGLRAHVIATGVRGHDLAKAAAQSDYEARINSAIEQVPVA